ncbi:unnamed protein product [Lota lota]
MAVERRFLPFALSFLAPALGCGQIAYGESVLYPSQRLTVLREMYRRKLALPEEAHQEVELPEEVALSGEVALLEEALQEVEEDGMHSGITKAPSRLEFACCCFLKLPWNNRIGLVLQFTLGGLV